ncbi:class C sortase [Corynebacterium kozikiae]|uniref:class C sortase n=1 Tax=Corynebacterium kozikiae TaxID=2968469 RepID=UPI00211BF717|nr:class C sortase [Corynebacterium sp. 76QC2CO]MCQ9343737.1 class C sortase [Corynebacterium sp. 76QC2CO]
MTVSTNTRKKNSNAIIAVLLIVLGLGVLLYPVVATQLNNFSQAKAARDYAKLEQSAPQEVLDLAWQEAHLYNEQRSSSGGIMDAWNDRADETSEAYQRYLEYLSQLADTDAMGRIIIPAINSDLPIYHGTSEDSLGRGVGHLYGTDLPVGGEGRHSVLSAHTGLQNATLWDNLVKLKEGDAFYLSVAGHKLKYQVDQIKVVEPHVTEDLVRVEGQDYITLVTCTPYGINTHRLLVRGHQVPLDPAEEKVFDPSNGMQWQWWMWVIVGASVVIIALLVWWLRRLRKPQQQRTENSIPRNT